MVSFETLVIRKTPAVVSLARADREVAIRKARSLLPFPALTVDELHCPKGLLLPLYTDADSDPLGPASRS